MLERFSLTVATATIIAVLGKLGFLYAADKQAGKDWLVESIDQSVLCNILLIVFLILFRGKMMHDDATFFNELTTKSAPPTFKSTRAWKLLIKVGILLGYFSWVLWVPAIYFLENHFRFSAFLIASLLLSTFWLLIDILTRTEVEFRRVFWITPNIFYIALLALLTQPSNSYLVALGLLSVLLVDWLKSDPFSGHV